MTFKKGREYAEGRRVSMLQRNDDGSITARVTGSEGEKYDVRLEAGAQPGTLSSQCSCQSWNKYGPHCKHVVAMARVYLTRVRAAETKPEGAPAAPPEEVVALPALAKL